MKSMKMSFMGFGLLFLAYSITCAQEAGKDSIKSMDQLPTLSWAVGGLEGLKWGMSKEEVESVLGRELRKAQSNDEGEIQYKCDFVTQWNGQRLECRGSQNFFFIWNKLFFINLEYSGKDFNGFLDAVFHHLGYGCWSAYGFDFSFDGYDNKPIEENRPAEINHEEYRLKENIGHDRICYTWFDSETQIRVGDSYYEKAVGQSAYRSIYIDFSWWSCPSLSYQDKEREKANHYLDYINWIKR